MLICRNCHYDWTAKETIHSLVSQNLICPSCKTEQYISSISRKKTYVVTWTILYLNLLLFINQVDLALISLINFVLFLSIITVLPSFFELSLEKESIWKYNRVS